MSRALELFNKTNQFNTTGERYTLEQCHQRFVGGQELYVIQARDRFTEYGLVGAAWVHRNRIEHLVMSCRALGLGIEDTFLDYMAKRLARQNVAVMFARLHPTNVNSACHPFYSRNGFTPLADSPVMWSRQLVAATPAPALPDCDACLSAPSQA